MLVSTGAVADHHREFALLKTHRDRCVWVMLSGRILEAPADALVGSGIAGFPQPFQPLRGAPLLEQEHAVIHLCALLPALNGAPVVAFGFSGFPERFVCQGHSQERPTALRCALQSLLERTYGFLKAVQQIQRLTLVIAGVLFASIDGAGPRVGFQSGVVVPARGVSHSEEFIAQRPARMLANGLLEIAAGRFEIPAAKGVQTTIDGGLLRQRAEQHYEHNPRPASQAAAGVPVLNGNPFPGHIRWRAIRVQASSARKY